MDKLATYAELEHAQGLDTISLYLANIGVVGHGLEVRGVWSGSGEKGKPILGFLLRFF